MVDAALSPQRPGGAGVRLPRSAGRLAWSAGPGGVLSPCRELRREMTIVVAFRPEAVRRRGARAERGNGGGLG